MYCIICDLSEKSPKLFVVFICQLRNFSFYVICKSASPQEIKPTKSEPFLLTQTLSYQSVIH